MTETQHEPIHPVRARVIEALSLAEDVIYTGLGILLAVYAFALLVRGFREFIQVASGHATSAQFVDLLDQVLLVLLVVELLYTVQVSFRERGLVTEPFLVVALISVIRRVLVLTAQLPELAVASESIFIHAAAELVLLTLMIVVLVGSLLFVRKQAKSHDVLSEDERGSQNIAPRPPA
jgi:uncharacterized membrane protein (DUF373 family)